jgi:tetratricopeptide (TPR) repeat protein
MGKDYNAAIKDCNTAIEIDPKFEKAYFRLATCLTQLGHLSEARGQLMRLSEKEQKNQAVIKHLKEIDEYTQTLDTVNQMLEDKSKARQAFNAVNSLLEHMSESVTVQVYKVRALIGLKRFDKAKEEVNILYNRDQTNVDFVHWRGVCFYYGGNEEMALQHFRNVLQMDPDNKRSRDMFKLVSSISKKKEEGNQFFKDGDCQRAVTAYTEALAFDHFNDSFNATVLSNRAAAWMKLSNWKNAVDDCTGSLLLKPDVVKVLMRRARARVEMEDFDNALRDLQAAGKVEPNNDDIDKEIKQVRVAQKRSKTRDFYKILGVPKSADLTAIKKAYKLMAMKWHPDKNNESPEQQKAAEAKFKEITEAYEVLSDEKKKRQYDLGAELEDINQGAGGGGGHSHGGMGGMDMSHIFQMFGGGMGGMGGRRSSSRGAFGF